MVGDTLRPAAQLITEIIEVSQGFRLGLYIEASAVRHVAVILKEKVHRTHQYYSMKSLIIEYYCYRCRRDNTVPVHFLQCGPWLKS